MRPKLEFALFLGLFLFGMAICPAPTLAAQDEGWRLQRLEGMDLPFIESLLALQRHHDYIKKTTHKDVAKALKSNGWRLVGGVVESKSFIRGYVAKKGSDLVVCFRGTGGTNGWQTFRNWLTDFRFLIPKRPTFLRKPKKRKQRDPFKGVMGHRGFIAAYDGVRKGIIQRVRKNKGCRVWVTGFSLGGAIANLCALDIQVNLGIRPNVALFGSPRVGYGKYHKLHNARLPRCIRVVSDKDPVPRVPNDARFFHDGRLLQLYPSGKAVPLAKVSGAILGKKFKVPDHDRDKYRAMLRSFRKLWKKKLRTKVTSRWLVEAAKQEEKNRLTVRHLGTKAVAGVKKAGSAVVSGTKKVGKAVGKGAKKAGKTVIKGAKKAGTAVKKLFTRKKKKKKKKKRFKLW